MKSIDFSESELVILLVKLGGTKLPPETTEDRRKNIEERSNKLFNRIEGEYNDYKRERSSRPKR